MKFSSLFLIIALAILFGCTQKETTQKNISLEDFFKNPEKTSFQISPDGKYFSFKAPYEGIMNLFVQEVGKDSAVQLTFEKERDISGYFWANSSILLFLKDDGGDENHKGYVVNYDGSNLRCLTDFPEVKVGLIDDLPERDEEVMISMNKRNPQLMDPYRLNITTGELTMLAENPGNVTGWITDHEGVLRMNIAMVGAATTLISYRESEDQEFEPMLEVDIRDGFSPFFFTADNKKLYATSNLNRDKAAAILYNPVTKTEEEVLYQNDEVDVGWLNYSNKKKKLIYAGFTAAKTDFHFFDDEAKKLYERLGQDLGQYEYRIVSSNKEETVFMVRTFSDKTKGAYYVFDVEADKLTKIHEVSPWLDETQMADMKPVKYTSRDGLTINGYLTLPTSMPAVNLPVVINPHGGPWARDYWGFNPEIQFLANRGYAVLQMNFRGSTGFGKDFWFKSKKQWGQTMQNDITDGVNWLVEQGIADKEKIAIYGGSYGGYATLAGLTKTPELYACGVDYVGVSNLFTFMETIPPYWEPFRQYLYEMVGHPVNDSVMLAENSPVFMADKIQVPVFVAQGANDPRVKISESDQIVEALKKNNIDVMYMIKDDEGHGFRTESNRMDFYRAMESFLGKHLLGIVEETVPSEASEASMGVEN